MIPTNEIQPRMKRTTASEPCAMTFKVRADMRRAIRMRAVEEDVDVSELIRRVLTRYLSEADRTRADA